MKQTRTPPKKTKDKDKVALNKGIFGNKWARYTDIITTVETKKREAVLQVQFVRFLLFIGLLMGTIQLSTRVTEDFEVQKSMMDAFINSKYQDPDDHGNEERYENFYDISSKEDFWQWFERVVVDHTFSHKKQLTATVGQKLKEGYYVSGKNQLLWGISIRQQRAMKATSKSDCIISSAVVESGILGPTDCDIYASGNSRQTKGYGGLLNQTKTSGNDPNATVKYLYEFREDSGAGVTNPGGYYLNGPDGYVVDFLVSSTKQEIKDQIKTLKCIESDPVDYDADHLPLWDIKLNNRSKCEP